MGSPLRPLRAAYQLYRMRARRKAGRSVRVRVASPTALLAALDAAGVRNVVMRWFDEVPVTPAECAAFTGDVDVLVDDTAGRALADAAAAQPGRVAVECRSVTGEVGAFAGMPYLPPAFADEILAARVPHPRGFHAPAPQHVLPLLLFHLCYQKAEASGIPTGTELATGEGKRDYAARLREVAAACGETLPEPLTLLSIDAWLRGRGFDMQLDLLARWPLQTPWIRHLRAAAEARTERLSAELPELIVFILRDDLTPELRALAEARIASWFDVLEAGELDAEQRLRCLRHLRGGNWYGRRGKELAGPTHYVICNDPTPKPVTDARLAAEQPHVTNARVRLKHTLREELRAAARERGTRCRHALHSSDNRHEAAHFLEVLVGDGVETRIRELAARVQAGSGQP